MLGLALMISIIANQPANPADDTSIYTIPASETMPEPMSFVFEQAQITKAQNEAVLSFKLPALLDGPEAQTFVLKGSILQDKLLLDGDGARADCSVTQRRTDCNIVFDNLQLDHEAANQVAIETGGKTFAEKVKAGREAFEHQAVGVVSIIHKKK